MGDPAPEAVDRQDDEAAHAEEDAPAEEAPASPEEEPAGGLSLEERIRRFSSPLVRSIAEKEGVDLRQVAGTGIHGRVTKKDILEHLEQKAPPRRRRPRRAAPIAGRAGARRRRPRRRPRWPRRSGAGRPGRRAPAPAAAAAPAAGSRCRGAPRVAPSRRGFHVPAYLPGENVVIEPMSRIRQITAQHMVYSKATSAHVTTVFHIDMSRVAAPAREGQGALRQARSAPS